MTQFLRYPEPAPMSAAAASRPRDATGRVLMPVRLEARFLGGTGYRRFFDTFDEVAQWMTTDEFTATSHALKGLMITRQDPDPGPEVTRAARPRSLAAAIHGGGVTAAPPTATGAAAAQETLRALGVRSP